jgi:hypothetical protein
MDRRRGICHPAARRSLGSAKNPSMNIPFLQRTKATLALSFPPLHPLRRILQRTRICTLVTREPWGEMVAHSVRLYDWSLERNANLWFVVPKRSGLAQDLAHESQVTVEIADPQARKPIRLAGNAQFVDGRPSPVYLHPSVRSATLRVDAAPLDFAFLMVELHQATPRNGALRLAH